MDGELCDRTSAYGPACMSRLTLDGVNDSWRVDLVLISFGKSKHTFETSDVVGLLRDDLLKEVFESDRNCLGFGLGFPFAPGVL